LPATTLKWWGGGGVIVKEKAFGVRTTGNGSGDWFGLVNVKRSRLVAVCRHAALQPVVLFLRAEGELSVKQEKKE
jgi:hypothetical protein